MNPQKIAWQAHLVLFKRPFAYKRHVSHLSTKKAKKHTATDKKTGEGSLWRCFLVRCVPFSGPWDLGDACAWRFAIGFSGALVDFWVKPWEFGVDLMPPKTLGGAETPGVQLWFSWLILSPENLAGLDTPPKILRSQSFPPKGGLSIIFGLCIRYIHRGET